MKILEGRDPVTRIYDAEADVLYLSVGAARPALGVDIGDGIVLRYDEAAHEARRVDDHWPSGEATT